MLTSNLPSPGTRVTRAIERLRLPVARKRAPLSIFAGARLAASPTGSSASTSASRRAFSSSSASRRAFSSALSSGASGSTAIGSRSAPGMTSFFFSSASRLLDVLDAPPRRPLGFRGGLLGSGLGFGGRLVLGLSRLFRWCRGGRLLGRSLRGRGVVRPRQDPRPRRPRPSVVSSRVFVVCHQFVSIGFGCCACVRVVRAGVDLELGQLLAGEPVARQHPLDGLADHFLGAAVEHLGQRPRLDPARVAAVAPVGLLRELVAGDADLLGVDDDDEVAGVDVRRVLRLALAAQGVGDLGRQTAQGLALGVDDVPVSLAVWREWLHKVFIVQKPRGRPSAAGE